jgi:hypothetical protein
VCVSMHPSQVLTLLTHLTQQKWYINFILRLRTPVTSRDLIQDVPCSNLDKGLLLWMKFFVT